MKICSRLQRNLVRVGLAAAIAIVLGACQSTDPSPDPDSAENYPVMDTAYMLFGGGWSTGF